MTVNKKNAHKDRVVSFVLKTGIVTGETQAKALIISVSLISLTISAITFAHYLFGVGNNPVVTYVVPEELKIQVDKAHLKNQKYVKRNENA